MDGWTLLAEGRQAEVRDIARRYLASYRKVRPVDADLLERWVAVQAAAPLAHGIDDERDGLRPVVADAFGP